MKVDVEKKNYSLVVIILLSIIILGLVGYICYDLGSSSKETAGNNESAKEEVSKPSDDDKTDVVKDNNTGSQKGDKTSSNNASIKVYSSDDGKYYLVLTEYSIKPVSPKGGNVAHNFELHINEYYSGSSVYGFYNIENNKITLYGTQGCTAYNGNNGFNCTLPEGASVSSKDGIHTIVLGYSENEIMLGNVKLALN